MSVRLHFHVSFVHVVHNRLTQNYEIRHDRKHDNFSNSDVEPPLPLRTTADYERGWGGGRFSVLAIRSQTDDVERTCSQWAEPQVSH